MMFWEITTLVLLVAVQTHAQLNITREVATECRLVPSPGRCDTSRRRFWSYSGKVAACTQLFGCYSIRDRNVFPTKQACENLCFRSDTAPPPVIPGVPGTIVALECRINAAPGRCFENQRRSFWTYSSKTRSCTEITGCYTITDRNIWLSREMCRQRCFIRNQGGNPVTLPAVLPDTTVAPITLPATETPLPMTTGASIKISLECRITPSPGRCRDSERRTVYSYSSKTGDCQRLFGCYGLRDRNVFLTLAGCRRNCFVSDGGNDTGKKEPQCYITPAPGRCQNGRRRRIWTYSSQIDRCTQIYGCYSIRDRNVFTTRDGCQRACSGNSSAPIIVPDIQINNDCRITPAAGNCRVNERRRYYSLSTKAGTCVQIFGCYSLRDRNVFLTRESCRENCYIDANPDPPRNPEPQCYLNPSPGRCQDNERRRLWSYSSKLKMCTEIFGCYSIRDRNVFATRGGCEVSCAVNTNSSIITPPPGSKLNIECRVTPSVGRCREDQKITIHSYSVKTGTCVPLYGCYSLRDRNVFLSQAGCTKTCFPDSTPDPPGGMDLQCYLNPTPGRCFENQKRSVWTYSPKLSQCTQIFGCYTVRDRNVFSSRDGCEQTCAVDTNSTIITLPEGTRLSIECRVTPTAGRCRDSQRRTFYSYSAKTGTCTQIYGCYSIRDRNVFTTSEHCQNNCFINTTTGPPIGDMDYQCNISPTSGQCSESEKRSYFSYSPKVAGCTEIFGCYSLRDRNIFPTREMCKQTCAVDSNVTALALPDGFTLATECRITPSAGFCVGDQRQQKFYSYSSKTGTCVQIYGCYGLTDRNVFTTSDRCVDVCFVNTTEDNSGANNGQCRLSPSPGRCHENQKKLFWTYSSKIMECAEIYGCYTVRDRNVFHTKYACENTCAQPVESAARLTIEPNYIEDPEITLSIECRVTPVAGQCREDQKRAFYSYSGKTSACTRIFGCYSIRDRNVFYTREQCVNNCYVNATEQPQGGMDSQCYITPVPGRCQDNQRRMAWSYSSKTSRCEDLFGCYSLADRNVFLTQSQCDNRCAVDNFTEILPGPGISLSSDCRITPSPGNCRNNRRGRYHSYSTKTGTCTELFGCYSIRDRNVFLTQTACFNNCFYNDTDTPSGMDTQCYLVPSPGRCADSQKRRVWTYSSKLGGCTDMYGCYSIRDRNVFTSRANCQRTCAVDNTSIIALPEGVMLARECRMTPNSGICREDQKRAFYSVSVKTGACEMIYGCYSVRDRNVFLTEDGCRRTCYVNATDGTPINGGTPGIMDRQCYLNPDLGSCSDRQKRFFWSYDLQSQECREVYGCFIVTDRNKFINKATCDQACFRQQPQCFINPSPGRCTDNRRQTYYSFSSKTDNCEMLTGCYSILDRNVFSTLAQCRRACGENARSRGGMLTSEMMVGTTRREMSGRSSLNTMDLTVGTADQRGNLAIGSTDVTRGNLVVGPASTRMAVIGSGPGSTDIRGNLIGTTGVRTDFTGGSAGARTEFIDGSTGSRTEFIDGSTGSRTEFIDGSTGSRTDFIDGSTGSRTDFIDGARTEFTGGSTGVRRDIEIGTTDLRGNMAIGSTDMTNGNLVVGSASTRMAVIGSGSGSSGMQSSVAFRNLTSLSDITPIFIEPGIRTRRECMINPSPGMCAEYQKKSFWSFSTKINSCTRISGCYDIHDRNTWLTQEGCNTNCFKNTSAPDILYRTPLECQLNPTPGRCLPSDEGTYWSYNNKLGSCMQITGCYDFHDRNVWGSLERCKAKCLASGAAEPLVTEVTDNVTGERTTIIVDPECHINPSPGRCLDSQRSTFWTFSSKTSSCIQVTGCYDIRDRNTWLSRQSCRNNCFIDSTDIPSTDVAVECRLVPSPGECLENQRNTVWTYSGKFAGCTQIEGCYDFHDRNVWATRQSCIDQCHVKNPIAPLPSTSEYDVATECQISPTAGRCAPNERRRFSSYSTKTGDCVPIFGCYTINDRNVWYTRNGCRTNCLIPKPNPDGGQVISPACRRAAMERPCRPGQNRLWWTFDNDTGGCKRVRRCLRRGDRNVFISKKKCESNCFRKGPIGPDECDLNPSPGTCSEQNTFWTFSQKTGTCKQVTGCYSIRDRNIWTSREMCRSRCVRPSPRQSQTLPNFMLGVSNQEARTVTTRGRRGRLQTRNTGPDSNTGRVSVNTGAITIEGVSTQDSGTVGATGNTVSGVAGSARRGTITIASRGRNTGGRAVSVNSINRSGAISMGGANTNINAGGTANLIGITRTRRIESADVSRNPALATNDVMPPIPVMREGRASIVHVVPISRVLANLFETK